MASPAWWVVVLAPGAAAFAYALSDPVAGPEPGYPITGAVVLTVAAAIQAAFRGAVLAAPGPALARVVLLALGLLVGIGVVFAGLIGIVLTTTCWDSCSTDPSDGPGVVIAIVALIIAGLVWWVGVYAWRAFGERVRGSGLTPRPLLLVPAIPVWAAAGLAAVLR